MRNVQFLFMLLGLGLAVMSFPNSEAHANDGTSPWIHELIQSGQDVKVTLAIVDPGGEPNLSYKYTLERNEEIDVIKDRRFVDSEIVEQEDRCRSGASDEEQCLETPEDCDDCDGDGVLECWDGFDGWCETINYVEVIDECVPAGLVDYRLYAFDWNNHELDYDDLEVSDSGEECDPSGKAGSGGDDGGCSVSGVGAGSGSGPLTALLMLGIGLIATRMRRR